MYADQIPQPVHIKASQNDDKT